MLMVMSISNCLYKASKKFSWTSWTTELLKRDESLNLLDAMNRVSTRIYVCKILDLIVGGLHENRTYAKRANLLILLNL